jgi:hemoglobin-like flavoprotein
MVRPDREKRMTREQIFLVQRSWRQVQPVANAVAELFYARLFALDPGVQTLFTSDMHEQRRKLMAIIGSVVSELSRLERIAPAVQELGRRHVAYGVRDEHYAMVGAALLWALERALSEAFTPDVKSAWASAYRLLAKTMQDAAAQVPA